MSHAVAQLDVILAFLIFLLSAVIAVALVRRKQNTGIQALNLLIYLFISLALVGLIEFTGLLFHEYIFFLPSNEASVSLIFSPVRLANLASVIVLYFFAENILEREFNITRFSILIILLTIIVTVGIISRSLGILLSTDMIIPFANSTRLDEFVFDILQAYIITFVMYMFWRQHQFTDNHQYRNYIRLLLAATMLYAIAMIFEVAEHLVTGINVNAFISAFPTIALTAYIYLRYPNLIYLVPTDVRFLQLITVDSGIPVYVAEFEEEQKTMDFLIGPGLSSIRTMLKELLVTAPKDKHQFKMRSFEYNNGFLIFEESTGIFALLQADRLSKILITSLTYFLTEFESKFGDQLSPFRGNFKPVNGLTPDDLLRKCVPIVEAKPIISSLNRN